MAKRVFLDFYKTLLEHYGPQEWWPAESPLEMIVGAVLTQNTNWQNVENALAALKQAGRLDFEALYAMPQEELANVIVPAGYYNLKAKRLKNLLHLVATEYGGDVQALLDDEPGESRRRLLEVNGVGEETADSILLYGGNHPVFVVDAYTHRVFHRHNLIEEECGYGEMQERLTENLPVDPSLYNEYHALIVKVGKEFCKKNRPLCKRCPLRIYLDE